VARKPPPAEVSSTAFRRPAMTSRPPAHWHARDPDNESPPREHMETIASRNRATPPAIAGDFTIGPVRKWLRRPGSRICRAARGRAPRSRRLPSSFGRHGPRRSILHARTRLIERSVAGAGRSGPTCSAGSR
jgi:hypothetical protein